MCLNLKRINNENLFAMFWQFSKMAQLHEQYMIIILQRSSHFHMMFLKCLCKVTCFDYNVVFWGRGGGDIIGNILMEIPPLWKCQK